MAVLSRQLEALQAKCEALQTAQEQERSSGAAQHAAVSQELAASHAALEHLEKHAARSDAELERLSRLLSGMRPRGSGGLPPSLSLGLWC